MTDVLVGLEPSLVWKHFGALAAIPRSSKHEDAVTRYVQAFAHTHSVSIKTDRVGNLLLSVPASPGHEEAPSLCMQGHLDMVCEKNADVKHDFMKDPILLERDGDVIHAKGTTLGADNGLGVAAMLALIEDKTLVHGPLEFLMTIDEESGLTGAKNLDGTLVQSRILLNLDSEEEGALYVGCSGGRDTLAKWDLSVEDLPEKMQAFKITVKGLRGGHSGLDIDKQRGNAIKILNRFLLEAEKLGMRLGSIEGGNKRNAIPREAAAYGYIPNPKWALAQEKFHEFKTKVQQEFKSSDPGLDAEWEGEGIKKGKVFKRTLQKRLIRLLDAIPHGVIKMSHEIPGLVQTSTNFGVLNTGRKQITISTSQRSSVPSELDYANHSIASLLHLAGGEVEHSTGYPGWNPNLQSQALALVSKTHEQLFHRKPDVKAIHAGLECGIIGEKYPGIDMVSFGPTIVGAHSPDEHVQVQSVEKFWMLLREVITSYAAN
ncbi:MAG: aminoacyl-histidine dipeptidase [Chitinophagaceae bacterium]|nr:aminoacyl-histidine dipeptidase [Oligoflexus sp.]